MESPESRLSGPAGAATAVARDARRAGDVVGISGDTVILDEYGDPD